MPIYEFECLTCGERFEELMRLSDPDPAHCNCGKAQPVKRALTAPSFRLAGSGWYETDFKKDGDRKRNIAGDGTGGGDGKTGDSASAGGDAAKADAKQTEIKAPAPSTDAKPAPAPSAPAATPTKSIPPA